MSSAKSAVGAVLVTLILAPSALLSEDDPWQVLDNLRRNLGSTQQQASFLQLYLPAGFSTGDEESGSLFLSLPECVRWEYHQPFPKSFLLCDSTIHTWSAGDQAGRRFLLSDSAEPGIDLLRLQVEDLQQRYDATIEPSPAGGFTIALVSKSEANPIAQAWMTIDQSHHHLQELTYLDRDGNRSSFQIDGYQELDTTGVFTPPSELEWLDQ